MDVGELSKCSFIKSGGISENICKKWIIPNTIITIHTSFGAIHNLHVRCYSVESGCECVRTVGTLEEHRATCQFTLLPCPKECKDDFDKVKTFMRKELDEHLKKDCPNRDYICEYCGEEGTFASITLHQTMCPKKKIPCPIEGCSEAIEKQEQDKHIATECKHVITTCIYKNLGCDVKLKRKDMAAHEQDDSLHLHMAIQTINLLKGTLKSGQPMKFELTDYQRKRANDETVLSPAYYIYPRG